MSAFDPWLIVFMGIYLIAGVFLILLLIKLYGSYKDTKSQDILYFMIGLLLLAASNIVFMIRRPMYETFANPFMGDLLTVILQIPSELGVLFIGIFTVRFTFPKRVKGIISIIAIIVAIKWIVESVIILGNSPHYYLVDYNIVYTLDYALIRLGLLIPLYLIPVTVFFYYSVKIRSENKPKSNRALWLGSGMLCFAVPFLSIPILVVTLGHVFRLLEIFVLAAAIIFYICFAMPKWFKKSIGMIE